MRLLLDEMWTQRIAVELRKRDIDAVAINDAAHTGRYAGLADDEVFARAQEDERTLVTDNVADYERARLDWEARNPLHHGVIYALNPPFNRHRGDAVVGQMVNALEHFISSRAADPKPFCAVHFLRAVS